MRLQHIKIGGGHSWSSTAMEIYSTKTYIRKEEKSQVNNLSFHLKDLEMQDQKQAVGEKYEDKCRNHGNRKQ